MTGDEDNNNGSGEDMSKKEDMDAKGPVDEDEAETKFVEWDPTGRFGRVSGSLSPSLLFCFFCFFFFFSFVFSFFFFFFSPFDFTWPAVSFPLHIGREG